MVKKSGTTMSDRVIIANTGTAVAHNNDCDHSKGTEKLNDFYGNKIQTSKYTVLTFLPKNMFEQFQRVANAYFLALLILQVIPGVTPLQWYTTLIPLVFVLGISSVKDIFDDINRHKSDKQVNNRPTNVLRTNQLVKVRWSDVVVGDIIRMEADEFVAADIMIIASSEPHNMCYIETAELDGETKLKLRQGLSDLAEYTTIEKISSLEASMTCEVPNNNLYRFDGTLDIKGTMYPIDIEQVLLRGCVLRNTAWVFGMVVYAGHDTKLMMNSGAAPFKRTQMDRFMNKLIIFIFAMDILLCSFSALMSGFWEYGAGTRFQLFLPWPGGEDDSALKQGLLHFLTFIILYNTLIPISLYVSVEIIRMGQSWLIDWDVEMYYAPQDTAAQARTSTLNEELGQIEYIFSDKTGTLTQNIMTFLKCSIQGVSYGIATTEATMGAIMAAEDPECVAPTLDDTTDDDIGRVDFSWNEFANPNFEFYDQKLMDVVRSQKNEYVNEFFRLLAVCHTVVVEHSETGMPTFKAQSPDEEALVSASCNFGYYFKSREPSLVTISLPDGSEESYTLLHILEFNSDRKRMSVIVRRPSGQLTLLVKGADSIIYERLSPDGNECKEATTEHLEDFASEGLRTLCLAKRDLGEEEYEIWQAKSHEAHIALEDREGKVDEVNGLIESDLKLIGATAIEDKLQDGVPETIATLASAGIKIWVLTGDKQETAINIGFASCLLTTQMNLIIINATTKQQCLENLNNALEEQKQNQLSLSEFPKQYALIIDGPSLAFALEADVISTLLECSCHCTAVICCRVSPLQKALVVKMVRKGQSAVTLAIGDGANDVSMIQMAHIGVGISGQEGRQAVLCSDYSFAQFRFLQRLLLVHGRWSYMRMSKFLAYFFFKNFATTLCHFWYAFFTGFSGQSVFDPWYITFYNMAFTALPVLIMGIFDRDVNDRLSLKYPLLYEAGRKNLLFNKSIFSLEVLKGSWVSLISFFIPLMSLHNSIGGNGIPLDDWLFIGTTLGGVMIVIVTIDIALEMYSINLVFFLSFVLSLASWWVAWLIFYNITLFEFYGMLGNVSSSPFFWLVGLVTTVAVLVPIIAFKYWHQTTLPTPIDIVREMAYLGTEKLTDSESEIVKESGENIAMNIIRSRSRSSIFSRRSMHRSHSEATINGRRVSMTGYAFAQEPGLGKTIVEEGTSKAMQGEIPPEVTVWGSTLSRNSL